MTSPVRFETHPDRYVHWKLEFPEAFGGKVARLVMDVQEDKGLVPGYVLKLNSYDLGVDIELADALDRIRFEHPEVKALVVSSDKDRIFCSGANIYMLGSSTHAFKVNFCKFTNETRLGIEELSASSGLPSLAALNGTASGGGYELAIACDRIVLADDGSSAVSFPEAPLLGVLPGTGGLTRLVDKRKIRRDLADVFSTVAEGVRGKRAVDWGLVDVCPPRAKFDETVKNEIEALVKSSKRLAHAPMKLSPLDAKREDGKTTYTHVAVELVPAERKAMITIAGPGAGEPADPASLAKKGCAAWAVAAFRELDDALLDLRFNRPEIGVIELRATGDAAAMRRVDEMLARHFETDGLVREVVLHIGRVLKRLEMSAKSIFTVIDKGSCFVGTLFELSLAGDRTYMLDDDDGEVAVGLTAMNTGPYRMGNGLTRLESRYLRDPKELARAFGIEGKMAPDWHFELATRDADKKGLVTFAPDEIDWEDELRIAFEERAAMSPDAMTGMEASLRFGGPETLETKIFGRLSAWQNWIFQRPNAVGERGALTLYGRPERPEFDYRRT